MKTDLAPNLFICRKCSERATVLELVAASLGILGNEVVADYYRIKLDNLVTVGSDESIEH